MIDDRTNSLFLVRRSLGLGHKGRFTVNWVFPQFRCFFRLGILNIPRRLKDSPGTRETKEVDFPSDTVQTPGIWRDGVELDRVHSLTTPSMISRTNVVPRTWTSSSSTRTLYSPPVPSRFISSRPRDRSRGGPRTRASGFTPVREDKGVGL